VVWSNPGDSLSPCHHTIKGKGLFCVAKIFSVNFKFKRFHLAQWAQYVMKFSDALLPMTVAVHLENVHKTYNNIPVVNDLSFTINAGDMFGLLGPNGAGKSTTIRMLTTLTKPSQGQIEVFGYDVVSQPILAKQCLGVVLQAISVDGDLTVWENMELHARLHHIANPGRQRLIDQWLEYVELAPRRNSLVKTLSGGMKRRLQIARALLHQPQILFLDEPTVGLDPQTRRRLWEIIRDLNKQGMTMLLTTHYMDEVEYLCDRIGIMDGGKLISLGTLQELRSTHGEGLVVKQVGERWEYVFFPTLEDANSYLNQQENKTGMMVRPSNLEDIFVELTGRKLD
jgi:ABC-2 type transport system ATP-binding protein